MSTRRTAPRHQPPPRRGASKRGTTDRRAATTGPRGPSRSADPELGSDIGWGWLGPPPRARYSAGWVLLPLRAFLGFTFCFAGLQKLANPAFFHASNPTSIQAQLLGASRRSPIHGLLGPLVHVAVPLGILIALGELAVGMGTLLGLWARIAAAGGALISLMLFLTVSFHSSPYYTGSDIVFVFAWLPLLIAGSGGVLSADSFIANRTRRTMGAEPAAVVPVAFSAVRRACGSYDGGRCEARRGAPCEPAPCPYLAERPERARRLTEEEIDRRTFAAKGAAAGALAGMGLLLAGGAAALGRAAGGGSRSGTPRNLAASGSPPSTSATQPPSASATQPPSASATQPTTAQSGAGRPAGTRIGPASAVPVGGAAQFQDPGSGDPSLVVQPRSGTFLAFDAVCPHAGCTVEYDPSSKIFVCPCHGSEFNGSSGAVEIGPADTGLRRITLAEGPDGQLYVT